MSKKIKIGSDFSGVGAFNQALKRLGIDYEEVFACDMDKYARKVFELNHGTPSYFPTDVYEREIPKESLDLYMTSPPCQAFSLAGKRLGEKDNRGILFYNSHEFIKINKPRFFIFENVKGLLSDNSGKTFGTWIELLGGKSVNGNAVMFPHEDSVPYYIYWKVLNAKNYNIPQNRERVFIVGIRDDEDNNFQFPKPIPLTKRLKDVLEPEVDEKYFLSDKLLSWISGHREKRDSKGKYPYTEDDATSGCITARYHKMGAEDVFIGTWRTHEDGKGFREMEDNLCPTIPARAREDGSGQPVIKIGAIRGRNPENPKSRQSGLETEQMLEINENGTSNALTTVQKDNVVVIGFERTEKAKIKRKESLKKGVDSGSFSDRQMVVKNQEHEDTILANPNPQKEGLIMIQSNTSKGYEVATENDSINFSVPSSKTRRGVVGKGASKTLDTQCNQGIYSQQRIRRLTPTECMRLMDFNQDFIEKTIQSKVVSESQMYKQCGNSIVVAVLAAIISKLKL